MCHLHQSPLVAIVAVVDEVLHSILAISGLIPLINVHHWWLVFRKCSRSYYVYLTTEGQVVVMLSRVMINIQNND